jgi:hypothetical protein
MSRARNGSVATPESRRKFLLLEDPQELRLRRRETARRPRRGRRAVLGDLEEAPLRGDRAGERAALVAEQLALEELVGEVGGVDAHERARRARRNVVDGARQAVLSGAGIAEDQYGGGKVGGALQRRHLTRERTIPGLEESTKTCLRQLASSVAKRIMRFFAMGCSRPFTLVGAVEAPLRTTRLLSTRHTPREDPGLVRRVSPEPLERVELPGLLLEDVEDHVAVVHEDPVRALQALGRERGAELLGDRVGDRPRLPVRSAVDSTK